MEVWQMREQTQKAYPGKKWELKVKKMSDAQILAIYFRLKGAKKIK